MQSKWKRSKNRSDNGDRSVYKLSLWWRNGAKQRSQRQKKKKKWEKSYRKMLRDLVLLLGANCFILALMSQSYSVCIKIKECRCIAGISNILKYAVIKNHVITFVYAY